MPDAIHVVQPISASRQRLWAALTDPRHLQNWQCDAAEGSVAQGRLRLSWPALGAEAALDTLDVEPRNRLVLSSGRTRVTFELTPEAVTLTHDGLGEEDEREGVRASWQVSLSVLDHYLREHFDQPRSTHWSVLPARTSAEAAHVFFTDQTALNAWLTRQGSGIGETGSQCHLRLLWDEDLSGIVLAKTAHRDVAITWRERDDSVLVLRTLPSPFVPEERILALCWSHWRCSGNDHTTQRQLELALGRLRQLMANRGSA